MRNDKFRDPIHGFIEVRPYEKEIIDSAPFQRLRNIKQLALTSYLYHGAEHTRFGHSIGVMHLATRAFRSAVSKGRYQFASGDENDKCIKWLEQILRLVALTHDLGHAPFSHAAEDLFPEKPTKAASEKKKYYKHEDMTEKIIKETEIADIIKKIGDQYKKELGEKYDITPEMICDIYSGRNPGEKSHFTFLKTLMDSELDCDKMDYLLRDSYYCGVTYGKYDIDRLISCLTIFTKDRDEAPYLGIETGGIQAFEAFVLARYFMFVQVYFHRTRRYFDLILSKALKECLPDHCFPIDVNEYLKWDDVKVMSLLREKADSNRYARDVIYRNHWTCVYHTKVHPQSDGFELFSLVKESLKHEFGSRNFKTDFLVDTSADKLPHKIIPQKHEIDEEETIAIWDESKNRVSTISDESKIINSLTEKIDIRRIYCSDKFAAQAKVKIKSLLNDRDDEEEECEDNG